MMSEVRTRRLMRKVLPPEVAVKELYDDTVETWLFPEEAEAVERAADQRRREFVAGRYCARRALAMLGLPATAIPRGARGVPQWPAGVVGSITHCTSYQAAAVAFTDRVAALGIDAEPHASLPDGVLDAVTLPRERARLAELMARVPGHWDRMLFSAKESVYKAWIPLTGCGLRFADADITINAGNGTFVARLRGEGRHLCGRPLKAMQGRWSVDDGVLVTGVTVTVKPECRI